MHHQYLFEVQGVTPQHKLSENFILARILTKDRNLFRRLISEKSITNVPNDFKPFVA